MIEQKLLVRLKEAQREYAIGALQRPSQKDSFEYGHAVGVIAGYEMAINILLGIVQEEKYGDKDL
jgi:hypothetical protein